MGIMPIIKQTNAKYVLEYIKIQEKKFLIKVNENYRKPIDPRIYPTRCKSY